MLRLGQVFFYWNWKIFWKNSHSRISLGSFTKIPISVVSLNCNCPLLPSLLSNFSLINANDVRFWFLKISLQIFFSQDWPYSIDIPWGNEEFIWSFTGSVFPISLIWFSMGNARAIAELFGSRFDNGLFFFSNLFGEKLGLFFFFLLGRFLLKFGFLIIFFWRHFLL